MYFEQKFKFSSILKFLMLTKCSLDEVVFYLKIAV